MIQRRHDRGEREAGRYVFTRHAGDESAIDGGAGIVADSGKFQGMMSRGQIADQPHAKVTRCRSVECEPTIDKFRYWKMGFEAVMVKCLLIQLRYNNGMFKR
jgi:hypothetical protein